MLGTAIVGASIAFATVAGVGFCQAAEDEFFAHRRARCVRRFAAGVACWLLAAAGVVTIAPVWP